MPLWLIIIIAVIIIALAAMAYGFYLDSQDGFWHMSD